MSEPIKIVIFDLGRVLIRICDNWRHACEVAGVPVPFRALDEAGKASLRELVIASEIGKLDLDEFCRRAAEIFGVEPKHVQAMSDAYLCGPYPGAIDLVNEVISSGVETACLSNTNINHWRMMLDQSGINGLPLERMNYRFASQDVGLRKPDDAIYAHVERISGKRAEQILFFDDITENIEAAGRRGWQARRISVDADPVGQMRAHLAEFGVLNGRR